MIYVGSLWRCLGAVYATADLHLSLLLHVMALPMLFFDTTPLGRVLNRFGKDVESCDTDIPRTVGVLILTFMNFLSAVIVICIVTPLALTCLVPLAIIFFLVQVVHMRYFLLGGSFPFLFVAAVYLYELKK